MFRSSLFLACCVVVAGCATTPEAEKKTQATASKKEEKFPSREEVAELAAKPAVLGMGIRAKSVALPAWDFVSEPARTEGPWYAAFQSAVAGRSGLVSASDELACAASAMGRFILANEGMPAHDVRAFIEGRCAVPTVANNFRYVTLEVPAEIAEDKVYEHMKALYEKMLTEQLGSGLQAANVWFGRTEKKALVVIANGRRLAHLRSAPRIPDANGEVVLEGEVLELSGRIHGVINHGEHTAQVCIEDSSVRPPQFRLRCPVLPTDASAWVEVLSFPPGQVLGSSVYSTIVFPAGAPVDHFERRKLAEAAAGDDVTSLRATFLRLLNAERAAAQLPPFRLSEPQSEVATKLAGHYFNAATAGGESRVIAERIVLGLLAGWEVEGTVRDGHLTSAALYPTRDAGDLLSTMLAQPSGRAVLMAKEHSHVALGGVNDVQNNALGMIVSAYSLFDPSHQSQLTLDVYEHIAKQRADRKVSPLMEIEGGRELATHAAMSVQNGKVSPEDALDNLLSSVAARMNRPVRGWRFEATRIEDLQFPEEILNAAPLGVELAVAYRREPGMAWGRYIVLMVVIAPEQVQQAAAVRPVSPRG